MPKSAKLPTRRLLLDAIYYAIKDREYWIECNQPAEDAAKTIAEARALIEQLEDYRFKRWGVAPSTRKGKTLMEVFAAQDRTAHQ